MNWSYPPVSPFSSIQVNDSQSITTITSTWMRLFREVASFLFLFFFQIAKHWSSPEAIFNCPFTFIVSLYFSLHFVLIKFCQIKTPSSQFIHELMLTLQREQEQEHLSHLTRGVLLQRFSAILMLLLRSPGISAATTFSGEIFFYLDMIFQRM